MRARPDLLAREQHFDQRRDDANGDNRKKEWIIFVEKAFVNGSCAEPECPAPAGNGRKQRIQFK